MAISKLTVKKLTQLAKEHGLKGYSKIIYMNWYGYWNHKKTLQTNLFHILMFLC